MKKRIMAVFIMSTILFTTGCSSIGPDKNEWEIISENEMRNKKTGVHYYYSQKAFCKDPICPVYLFNGQVKTTTDLEANR